MPTAKPILINQTFGKLTVISSAPNQKGHRASLCQCLCGAQITVRNSSLLSGHTRSCSRKCFSPYNGNKKLLHVRNGMITRCHNPNHPSYPPYGGRGITVCDEWRFGGVDAFFCWAISTGYQDGLQIDRIDNNEGYYPGNCRWVTPTQNSRNRSTNKFCLLDGRKVAYTEACGILGVPKSSFSRWARNKRLVDRITWLHN